MPKLQIIQMFIISRMNTQTSLSHDGKKGMIWMDGRNLLSQGSQTQIMLCDSIYVSTRTGQTNLLRLPSRETVRGHGGGWAVSPSGCWLHGSTELVKTELNTEDIWASPYLLFILNFKFMLYFQVKISNCKRVISEWPRST